ncbi:MAG: hypothetical protein O7H41_08650 [Planctomycetota bacterium]|nr:hypothetical protein [Planctomycetota bacterium]
MSRKWIDRGIGFLFGAEVLLFPLGISLGVIAHTGSGHIFAIIFFVSALSAAGVGVVLIIFGLVLPRSRKTDDMMRPGEAGG